MLYKRRFTQMIATSATNWATLRAWGNSRLIKSAYLWLIIVPIVAKLMHPLAGTHTMTVGNVPFKFTVGLPFSWVLFYFMAIVFAVAQLLYSLGCPEIVKKWADGGEYQRNHPGVMHLKYWIWPMLAERREKRLWRCAQAALSNPREDIRAKAEKLINMLESRPRGVTQIGYTRAWDDYLASCVNAPTAMDDIVAEVQRHYAEVGRKTAAACAAFFGIGFVLFGIVLAQNLWFVISFIWAR